MSVVLICFPGAPKISPEAVRKEAELDKYLESKVEGKTPEDLVNDPCHTVSSLRDPIYLCNIHKMLASEALRLGAMQAHAH